MNDADWPEIEACLNGDRESFGRLVHRYEKDIARLMWRFTRNSAVCEELIQEVFLEAYFSLKTYRRRAPFIHWLRKIATRVGYRFWREQARQRHYVSLEDFDGIETSQDSIDPAQAAGLLHLLLAQLPKADRLVLTLMYFEGCGTKEIAERMGWNRAVVKMRAHRARKKLRLIAERENLLERLGWTY